ncbi:MAG: response regulator transcription factor [Thermomicrobiales bacterium]|nr:response regulator transcription factor [Thermomicrobiales bacterium]
MTDADRATILVVDDEVNIREAIVLTLKREGFRVVQAGTGPEAVELAKPDIDVIVLDVMLPGFDGLEVLRRVRATSNTPVLMLSAKGDEIDRIVGLEIGADDYIAKPFAMRELVARIRAICRRISMQSQTTTTDADAGWIIAGTLAINPSNRVARIGDTVVDLKPKEFDLLQYFMRHPGVVLSRDALLREVWGYDYRMDTRTVDVHIRWLRTKLEHDPAAPTMFVTVRGSGYRFVPEQPR